MVGFLDAVGYLVVFVVLFAPVVFGIVYFLWSLRYRPRKAEPKEDKRPTQTEEENHPKAKAS